MDRSSGSLEVRFANQPELLSRFEVVNVLGDGAAGFVYRVRDKNLDNQEVALKVLANDLAFDGATLERFLAELKVCRELRHPNLVHAFDLIEFGDTVAYTMEYVDGGSLQSIFAKQRIGLEAIDRIYEQVLDAVQILHENNVIHRDIKLENVLVGTNGVVKLSDLGLMKQVGKKGLTRPGILLGTPQYMPPEYVREGKYDRRGDIYTLGLMLYELLSWKRWLSQLQGQEVITHLLKTGFKIDRELWEKVPRKYIPVLSKALEVNPDARYQSALEMKQDMARIKDIAVESSIDLGGALSRCAQQEEHRGVSQRNTTLMVLLAVSLLLGVVLAVGGALVLLR
ncbi:MAG: serine/threonine protein kinase [Proteobacteria bacterium]|nr:serine/threonine protein kinase [Pseudomonadota bacterium]